MPILKPKIEYPNMGNAEAACPHVEPHVAFHRAAVVQRAVEIETLAKRLGVESLLTSHRLRCPDGSLIYTPRFRWYLLIKSIIEDFCPHFVPGGVVAYIGDTENKFAHLEADYLAGLGVSLDSAAKMPDVIIHCTRRNWLLLIEAVTSAGPVDGKRRKELKELFAGCKAGLVFVTAFGTRRVMQSFLGSIAWESEVWIAEDPAHMIHFNGDKFLGPYPDTTPIN
ncbi:MAG TPA: BsuBI/PstI family type II restriction endonuclease [Chthoniobacter sp.]